MGFPRQEYWSGLPFPSPGDLSDPGIKPRSPALQADSLPPELPGKPSRMKVVGNKNARKYYEKVNQFPELSSPLWVPLCISI